VNDVEHGRRIGPDDSRARLRQVPALLAQEGPENGRRRNLGTFASRAAAEKQEREMEYFVEPEEALTRVEIE